MGVAYLPRDVKLYIGQEPGKYRVRLEHKQSGIKVEVEGPDYEVVRAAAEETLKAQLEHAGVQG